MPLPRNPLVDDLLAIAEALTTQTGRPSLRQAALRRSASTAYYALFHALCTLCSDSLVRWSRTDLVDRTYRSLDHGIARRRLASLGNPADSGFPLKAGERALQPSAGSKPTTSRHGFCSARTRRCFSSAMHAKPSNSYRPWTKMPDAGWRSNVWSQSPADPPPCQRHTPRLSPARHSTESFP